MATDKSKKGQEGAYSNPQSSFRSRRLHSQRMKLKHLVRTTWLFHQWRSLKLHSMRRTRFCLVGLNADVEFIGNTFHIKYHFTLMVQKLLIYPPPPARGGITITTKDYYCLEEGQFLNDVILDFYLKYLVLEKLSKEDKERTHLFSTFFYKRLTSKPKMGKNVVEDNRVMSPAEIRHARVKSWTKNVDIFKKDFIIIPINERSHWFLAVICFPRLISSTPVTIIGNSASADINKKLPTNKQNKTEIPIVEDTEWSDKDEAESEEENLIVETEEVSQIKKPRMENDPEVSELSHKVQFSAQPCILIFDSLAGGSRSRIVATLRDYLSVEYFEKKQIRKIFSKDLIKGACLNVPQQTNFTDCGIFTLQFAESFFETPLKTFKFPIPSLTNWFTQDCVSCKREQIARKIEKLMNEFKPHHGIKLMKIIFKSSEEVDNKSPKIEKKVTERHEIICELKNKKSKVAKNADSAKSKKLHTPEDDTYKEIIIEDIRSVSVIHTQPRIPKRPLTPGPYRKPEPKYQTPLVGLYGEKLSTLQRSIAAKSISITDVNQSSNSYTPNKILKQQFASTSSHFSKPKSLKGGESNWKSKSSSLEGGGTKSKAEEEEDVIFENEILMPKLGYRHFPQKQSVAAVKGVDLKDKSLSTTNIVINNCQGNQHQTPNRSVLVKTKPSEYDYHY